MAGWIDTAIYQTIIATQGRGWIGKLFEYLEWLCTQSSTARIIFLPVSRLYLWFVICWLLPLSARHRPQCPMLSSVRHSWSSHRPRLSDVTSSLLHRQVSLTWLTHHYHHQHSQPGWITHTGLILAGGSNFAAVTKKVSYERDDRAWDSQTIRDYQLSFVLAPAANTHSPHTRSFTKVSAIHILLLIKIGRQRQDNALSLTARRT